ncbi:MULTISPECIES: hypothetical protein [unclassified Thioalkalivibrio]|uniref:DUF6967 family protein n=1 Tax=unclassified Thioalkalivibrio TaxID=2621013 RepID=UPI0003658B48|nr:MULTISPECIES: hypothetical protein [unclassified Thioalkalivibrio]
MESIEAPFGEVVELRQILHDSGIPLLRIIIRDGGRYTKLDLDPSTAHSWGRMMVRWAESVAESGDVEGRRDQGDSGP